ncbi:MAG: site-2 protease family protein [Acidobacteriota bacterium]|nr:site-2 protease family protein [Acidobacteriota bacterium]
MFTQRFELFRAFGIPIRIDLSWFLIAFLITWSLAENVFPDSLPSATSSTLWILGGVATIGLFASILLHELAHALIARRHQLAIRGITLFIFGGVAELEGEPPDAGAEFRVAIAGPIASVLIGIACIGLTLVIDLLQLPAAAGVVIAFLASINFVLVVFNMIPAFPLDGGRVLRSALWNWKKDLRWATRVTSRIGSGFGMLLIVLGIWQFVARHDLIGGLWTFLIGMFLRNAAHMSYQQLLMRRALEGEPVSRFMHGDPVTVPRALSVADLVEQYVYRHHYKFFPVVDDGRLVGCVTTRSVKELPRSEWQRQSVGSITEECSPSNSIDPSADAMEALARMSREGISRLMVVESGRLVGILALKDMLGFLALKVEMEEG